MPSVQTWLALPDVQRPYATAACVEVTAIVPRTMRHVDVRPGVHAAGTGQAGRATNATPVR